MCVNDRNYLDIAVNNGILCGANTHAANRLSEYPLLFLDFAYKKPDIEKHMKICKRIHPKYVCVPDIMTESDIDTSLDYAIELEQYVDRVIIIPKIACVDRIEKKWMIGFSVPTKYGGAEGFGVWDIIDYDVHLLGGSPPQQLKYKNYLPKIKSFDGNSYIKIARLSKQYWDGRWISDDSMTTLELIDKSVSNIKHAWGIS